MILRGKREAMTRQAANLLLDTVASLLEQQEQVTIAIPGGRSVADIFEQLRQADAPWEKVHFFLVDERLVPLGSSESNYLLVKEHLLGGKIPESQVHPFVYDPEASCQGVEAYADVLTSLGSRFDIILVSSGEDGHIAALYPQHHSLVDAGLFVTMDDSPKPPSERMSSSAALLKKAQVGIVVFFGEGKRHALDDFLDEKKIVDDCPAKLIQELPSWFALTDLQGGAA